MRAKTAEETLRQANNAQEALTRSFVRTIGVSDKLQPDERVALWELAELDLANQPVREKVIDYWFQTKESIGRASIVKLKGCIRRSG